MKSLRGRWLEKLSQGRYKRLVFETKTTAAARAVADTVRNENAMELKFILQSPREDKRSGEMIDEVVVYMQMAEAGKLLQQMHHAYAAGTPRMPGPTYRQPFE